MSLIVYMIYRYVLLICESEYSFNINFNYIFKIELWEAIVCIGVLFEAVGYQEDLTTR